MKDRIEDFFLDIWHRYNSLEEGRKRDIHIAIVFFMAGMGLGLWI